jgi:RimJ/RimL family protein N-acetyltransferase
MSGPQIGSEDPLQPCRVVLRDGEYWMRPLHAGDEDALRAFFYSHTEETVYLRYGHALHEMSVERARSLVGVDPARDPAVGIFDLSGDEPPRLHAVGRYYLSNDGRGGEVAFVTRESKRRCGMATTLLRTLIATARARGLAYLWAQVLPDNGPMLAVFEKHGFTRGGTADGEVHVRLDLLPGKTPPAVGSDASEAPGQRNKSKIARSRRVKFRFR